MWIPGGNETREVSPRSLSSFATNDGGMSFLGRKPDNDENPSPMIAHVADPELGMLALESCARDDDEALPASFHPHDKDIDEVRRARRLELPHASSAITTSCPARPRYA